MISLVNKLPDLAAIFDLEKKIGEGTFSSVYLAKTKHENEDGKREYFAIKHLVPTCHPSRIVRELKCMQEIGGVDNVGGVRLCLRCNDCVTFIMPYQQHDKFSSYVMEMQIEETKMYLRELLVALRRVHKFSVIHRDVKPSNFLYSRKEKKFLLVDFGLAQTVGEWSTENNESQKESKKRKRADEEENQEVSNDTPSMKRPALQCLDSNIPVSNHNKKKTVDFEDVSWKKLCYNRKAENITFIQNSDMSKKQGEKLFLKPKSPQLKSFGNKCTCDGKAQICYSCLTRRAQVAPRAGTPGFRPPEVLLKYPQQTTAVDIWAVGVIMLCILSRTYPFFKSPDDVTALAEIITLFGSEEIKAVAKKLGRNVICSEVCEPLDLKQTCEKLANKKLNKLHQSKKSQDLAPVGLQFPNSAYDLLMRLLEIDPSKRITADEALRHPFLS